MRKIFLILLFLLLPVFLWAAPPSRVFTYTDGDKIQANKNTQNEDAIFNYLSRGVDKLADNAVATEQILNGTIINSDIAGSAGITYGKLAFSNNIVAGDIAEGAVGSSELASTAVAAASYTFASITVDADGRITSASNGSAWASGSVNTNTSQPAFLAKPALVQTNFATGSDITVVLGTEIFDQTSNFASNTFTAPVTGKYQLSVSLSVTDIDSAGGVYIIKIITSNRTYSNIYSPMQFTADVGEWCFTKSVLADMDINDTAYVTIQQTAGTQQANISIESWFSGALLF